MRNRIIEFRPDNDTEVLQFPKPLIQYFFGNARNITFEFSGAPDFFGNGCHNPGRPFTTNNILQAVIVGAFLETEVFFLHTTICSLAFQASRVGTILYPVVLFMIPGRMCAGESRKFFPFNHITISKHYPMKTKAVFYHAGCPVCVAAEQNVALALDPSRYEVEVVHLGETRQRLAEAENAGVKSVPALVLDGQAYHINHGADLSVLKG